MSEKVIACGLTLEDINGLADKVNNGSLSKIKIVNGDSEVIIEKETQAVMPVMPPVMATAPQAAAAPVQTQTEAAPQETALSGNVVKAPIVGTFYAAPSPDKDPFVKVGQQVKKGDVIMIIESMKLMNEVQSEFDGVVKEILIQDATPVEFDQPIMIIE